MTEHATSDETGGVAQYATPGARAAATGARYATISATFVGILLISNVVAVKPIAFGAITLGGFSLPMVFDGGVFLFPLAYVLGDVLAEVYGLKASRRAIFTAFSTASAPVVNRIVLAGPAIGARAFSRSHSAT